MVAVQLKSIVLAGGLQMNSDFDVFEMIAAKIREAKRYREIRKHHVMNAGRSAGDAAYDLPSPKLSPIVTGRQRLTPGSLSAGSKWNLVKKGAARLSLYTSSWGRKMGGGEDGGGRVKMSLSKRLAARRRWKAAILYVRRVVWCARQQLDVKEHVLCRTLDYLQRQACLSVGVSIAQIFLPDMCLTPPPSGFDGVTGGNVEKDDIATEYIGDPVKTPLADANVGKAQKIRKQASVRVVATQVIFEDDSQSDIEPAAQDWGQQQQRPHHHQSRYAQLAQPGSPKNRSPPSHQPQPQSHPRSQHLQQIKPHPPARPSFVETPGRNVGGTRLPITSDRKSKTSGRRASVARLNIICGDATPATTVPLLQIGAVMDPNKFQDGNNTLQGWHQGGEEASLPSAVGAVGAMPNKRPVRVRRLSVARLSLMEDLHINPRSGTTGGALDKIRRVASMASHNEESDQSPLHHEHTVDKYRREPNMLNLSTKRAHLSAAPVGVAESNSPRSGGGALDKLRREAGMPSRREETDMSPRHTSTEEKLSTAGGGVSITRSLSVGVSSPRRVALNLGSAPIRPSGLLERRQSNDQTS